MPPFRSRAARCSAANAYVFTGRTPLDQMRSEDCLAQAVYYEARSESEDGQRAVAQVVLNRVRHPAWPNSVCGVVYQGAMRAGGGCQFTFTCDGSLRCARLATPGRRRGASPPRRSAGRTFAPVGLSTFYHANYVFPAWAPQLVKTATIGAHIFYRLPGLAGAPGAFSNAYAGNEPVPPARRIARQRRRTAIRRWRAALGDSPARRLRRAGRARRAGPPSDIPQDRAGRRATCPNPAIREEHAQSGQWRTTRRPRSDRPPR